MVDVVLGAEWVEPQYRDWNVSGSTFEGVEWAWMSAWRIVGLRGGRVGLRGVERVVGLYWWRSGSSQESRGRFGGRSRYIGRPFEALRVSFHA